MEETPYLIGIDLGTTNSSVAYINRKNKRSKNAIKTFQIPQFVAPQKQELLSSLSSFHYSFSEYDDIEELKMPWQRQARYTVGEFAKIQGQKIPGNMIHSAKSWLCHGRVDRRSKILPWGTKSDIEKISPVEVSTRYLQYMRDAWNHFQAKDESEFFEKQKIVLTVPASFDEVARELTLESAQKANLTHVILLEEPMAAFYSWIYFYQMKWPKKIDSTMLTLVCDIGGGTTDFSLIEIRYEEENISFKRLAVGNHLLLGGDNMDLALAFHVEKQLAQKKLSSEQFSELVAGCRRAKEQLWLNTADGAHITVMGKGSSIIGGAQKFYISRAMLEEVLVDGFFPVTLWDENKKNTVSGFKEWGLPYENNPNILQHLKDFLVAHLPQDVKPDLVLFNGGVLTPKIIRDRITQQLKNWFAEPKKKWKPTILTNNKLDLAVSIGAAYLHLVQLGEGIHIEGGTAKTYYLEIKHENQEKAICVLPFGSRQQQYFEIDQHPIEVIAKKPVAFNILCSTKRKEDELGDIVTIKEEDIVKLPPLTTVIQVGKTAKKKQIPVKIQVQVNEIGILEVRLLAKDSDRVWRLQFQTNVQPISKIETKKQERVLLPFPENKIKNILERTFCGDLAPRTLKSDLEKVIGCKKEGWDLEFNRKLWDTLILFAKNKNKSEAHEERWLHFMGYCLRPGIGFPGDDWRIKKLLPFLQEKVHFEKNTPNWMEYWILWRRIAAGIKSDEQLNTFRQMGEHILGRATKWKMKKQVRKHTKPAELLEMWRAASSMENLPVKLKKELGDKILQDITSNPNDNHYWCLGRIGARMLLYGQNILPKEQITSWIETLLMIKDDSFHRISAIAQLSRKTGDRTIDIDESLRTKVLKVIGDHGDSAKILQLQTTIEEITVLDESMQNHYLGESLPVGLVLKNFS